MLFVLVNLKLCCTIYSYAVLVYCIFFYFTNLSSEVSKMNSVFLSTFTIFISDLQIRSLYFSPCD